MKKLLIIAAVLIVVVGMFAIMFMNKAKNQAKAKSTQIENIFPVNVAIANFESMNEDLSYVGTTYAKSEVNVVAEVAGRVVAVNVNVGDRISAGKEIARLDDELKKAAVAAAEANYEKTKSDLDRYTKLLKEKSVNEVQFEQAKLAFANAENQLIIAKRQFSDTKIKSPISGVVTTKMVEVGTYLNVANPVVNIVDISSLKIKVNVPESDVFKIKVGDIAELETDVYPNVKFSGKISNINAKGDEAHTFLVEINIPNNTKNELKAGMFLRARFNSMKKENALTIPRIALVGGMREPKVYVVDNGKAKLRNITIGAESSGKIEVLQGINQGEQVIINGQINLKDSFPVKIVK